MQISKNDQNIEQIVNELNNFVGMDDIKKTIEEVIAGIKKYPKENSRKCYQNILVVGPPGTGKSTIARIISKVLYEAEIITENKLITCNGNDLIGSYVGYTTKIMQDVVSRASGGILFIDEAHSLYERNHSDEVISTLIDVIDNNKENIVIILSGYKQIIDKIIMSNPGMARRFPYRIAFNNYSTEELMEIFMKTIIERGYTIDEDAKIAVAQIIDEEKANEQECFGNVGYIKNSLIPKICSVLEDKTNIAIETVKEAFPFEASLD